MVILRPTRKLSLLLPTTTIGRLTSDTALGDWYVNRIIVHRHPLLLLVSSAALLPMLVPARDVRNLPVRLANLVEVRLRHLGIGTRAIRAERSAMARVEIAPTVNRSVLGIMVDFAKSVPYYLEHGDSSESALRLAEDRLAQTPCYAGRPFDRVIFPEKKAPEVLRVKWPARTGENNDRGT